jgi:hypothetical protein
MRDSRAVRTVTAAPAEVPASAQPRSAIGSFAGGGNLVSHSVGVRPVLVAGADALLDRVFANPFDPAVDTGGEATSLLTQLGQRTSAIVLTAWWRTTVTVVAALQALILGLLLPTTASSRRSPTRR